MFHCDVSQMIIYVSLWRFTDDCICFTVMFHRWLYMFHCDVSQIIIYVSLWRFTDDYICFTVTFHRWLYMFHCDVSQMIMYVLLWCFTDEVEDFYADRTYIFVFGAASELRVRFRDNKTGLSPLIVFLLTALRPFPCCSSFMFVRLLFHLRRLFGFNCS